MKITNKKKKNNSIVELEVEETRTNTKSKD